jgi:hypothetical protein
VPRRCRIPGRVETAGFRQACFSRRSLLFCAHGRREWWAKLTTRHRRGRDWPALPPQRRRALTPRCTFLRREAVCLQALRCPCSFSTTPTLNPVILQLSGSNTGPTTTIPDGRSAGIIITNLILGSARPGHPRAPLRCAGEGREQPCTLCRCVETRRRDGAAREDRGRLEVCGRVALATKRHASAAPGGHFRRAFGVYQALQRL